MANGASSPFPQDSTWTDTYLLVLGIFTVANAVIFTLDTTLWHGGVAVVAYYNNLVDYFGGAAPFSILAAALATAAWRSFMLKSERVRQHIYQRGIAEGREEGREEGIAEGREEERRKQESDNNAWYERMRAAIERGEDFDEPPPWQRR